MPCRMLSFNPMVLHILSKGKFKDAPTVSTIESAAHQAAWLTQRF